MKNHQYSTQEEKVVKATAMSRFRTVLRRQADDEIQTVRELNTELARII
jgi:hypothetical protein